MAPSESDPKAQKILDAVRKVLAGNGYAGTTINLVAQEAGVSRGLLHYYFKNKDEMLARVLKANMEASIVFIEDIFQTSHSAREIADRTTALLRGIMAEDSEFFCVFLEAFAAARQSAIINEQLASLYGKFRLAILEQLKAASREGRIAPALPLPGLAAIITAIIDGVALQLVTEPDLSQDDEIWQTMAAAVNDMLTG
jgi:AcrR family transcriptional regulator